jgi:hypothetical protein
MNRFQKTLLVSMAATLVTATLGQSAKPSFSISINAPKTFKANSAVELQVEVRNTSDHPIIFGSFGLDRGEQCFIFAMHREDGSTPPDAAYMKSTASQFVHLKYLRLVPEESLKLSIDLPKRFDLSPGTYSLQLSYFENSFALYGPASREASDLGPGHVQSQQPAIPLAQPSPNSNLEVKSNTITFTVLP